LGSDALDALGKDVGDAVRVEGGDRTSATFHIVGRAVYPTIGDALPLSDGATLTPRDLLRLNAVSDGYLILRLKPDVPRATAVRHLTALSGGRFPPIAPTVPAEVERLRQVDFLVPVLGGLVALVASVAIGYTLVVAVRRRRHDLAILKAIGFDRRQVRTTVAWQATTLAAVGSVVGVPLGLVVGRELWALVAGGLGVSTAVDVSPWAIAAVVPAAFVVANAIAAFPAWSAARTPAAVVLRTE
jgi:ABC-type antimicrobial peptide transport system permease subunit